MGTTDFNPRAPCGARRAEMSVTNSAFSFQPTRPLRGATAIVFRSDRLRHYFNPRAPCGARPTRRAGVFFRKDFNPRAPCGARPSRPERRSAPWYFNPRAPCGARPLKGEGSSATSYFNPRAPCGARQQKCTNHYAHFCDNRQISDAFAQNAACQGILLLFDAGKPCGFWVRTAQVISARLCFAL